MIKTVRAFFVLTAALWVMARMMARTDAVTKALDLQQQLAGLTNDVANLKSGNFQFGIALGGVLAMHGNNISGLNNINTDGTAWGSFGDFYMNGKNIHLQGGSVIP